MELRARDVRIPVPHLNLVVARVKIILGQYTADGSVAASATTRAAIDNDVLRFVGFSVPSTGPVAGLASDVQLKPAPRVDRRRSGHVAGLAFHWLGGERSPFRRSVVVGRVLNLPLRVDIAYSLSTADDKGHVVPGFDRW